jgi:hypothetical protein
MSDHRKRIRHQIKKAIFWSPQETHSTNPQARVLAGLDVLTVLEENAPKYLQDVLHYGPASFAGRGWASALVWYRDKGYYTYRELTLFGVWVVEEADITQILLGTKPLQYSAPVYNASSYHHLIKNGFKTYYGDSGSPPPRDSIYYETPFDPTARLKLRQTLADEIIQWLRLHKWA